MTNKDAEYQLFSLMRDAQSHFTDDGDDEVFREDEEALMRAIIAIQRLTPRKPEISASGVLRCMPELPPTGFTVRAVARQNRDTALQMVRAGFGLGRKR